MNTILLRKARIIDATSAHHLKVRDVLIEKGHIADIKSRISVGKKVQIVESKDLHVSQGWVDIGCFNGEPGHEHREDLSSLKAAAAAGGYTALAPFPTTVPTLDNKGQLQFLRSRNNDHPVQIYPIAALTQSHNGADLAELLDMHRAGALAFTDGYDTTLSDGQIQRSLEYLKAIGGRLIIPALNTSNLIGEVNEGPVSIRMGMEGIPQHIEQINIDKLLHHVAYTEGKLLVHNISMGSASEKINKSAHGGMIQSSVAAMCLCHADVVAQNWNPNYKVLPPLRSEKERKKLCRAVEKGSVNVITSNHTPWAEEQKDEPFGLSPFGASTLETTYASLLTHAREISHERIITCLSQGPREVLSLDNGTIQVGTMADLTIFDPSQTGELDLSKLRSKSKNNPYLGQVLQGQVLGIITQNQITLNEIL